MGAEPDRYALQLDGNGSCAEVPNTALHIPASSFTLEAWVKLLDDPASGMSIIDKAGVRSTDGFSIDIYRGGKVRLRRGADTIFISGSVLPQSEWIHIAVVYDRDTVKAYYNGMLTTEQKVAHWKRTDGVSLRFGAGGCSRGNCFKGLMDEIRLWSLARSAGQIQQTMYDTLSAKYYASPDSHLIGYWRFDRLEDLGVGKDGPDDVRDWSVNHNHADLSGGAVLSQSGVPLCVDADKLNLLRDQVLQQNYPNPFNPSTIITYQVSQSSTVTLRIYDILGKEVAELVNQQKPAGRYQVRWNADYLSGGIYFYRLTTGLFSFSRKMLLLK